LIVILHIVHFVNGAAKRRGKPAKSCLGENVRYLRHIKPRNTEMIYGSSNVCTYRIEKESNFLGFKFVGYSTKRSILRTP